MRWGLVWATTDVGDDELAEELKSVTVEVNPDIHDQVMLLAGLATMLDTRLETQLPK